LSVSDDLALSQPMVRIAVCCAQTGRGNVAATPLRTPRKSRALRTFKRQHGHCLVPRWHMQGKYKLGHGVECTYSGRLSDFFTGVMNCPNQPAVPLMLWVK